MTESPESLSPGLLSAIDRFLSAFKQRCFDLMQLRAGDRLLDLGCGLGLDVDRLNAGPPAGVRAIGIDYVYDPWVSGGALSVNDRRVAANAMAVPFADASFDVIWSDRLLQHVERPADALAEMARVIRPGGRLVLADSDHTTVRLSDHGVAFGADLLAYRATCFAAPDAGARLPDWCRAAGLEVTRTEFTTVAIDSFEEARALGLFVFDWQDDYASIDDMHCQALNDLVRQAETSSENGEFRYESRLHVICAQRSDA